MDSSRGVQYDKDQGRNDDATDSSGVRDERRFRVPVLAGNEFRLQLQANDEEEDREQPIGCRFTDAEVSDETIRDRRRNRAGPSTSPRPA